MEAREALQQAIEFEERSAQFYRKNAEEMPDPVLRVVLAQLAEVEVGHLAAVRRACEAAGTESDLRPEERLGEVDAGLAPELEQIVHDANEALHNGAPAYTGIYQTALEFERKAAAFYRRAAVEHAELSPFFTTLALVEALHVSMMTRVLEANRTP